jgi:sulfur relay (sulfurtransferase) DsrF/TusC family protein
MDLSSGSASSQNNNLKIVDNSVLRLSQNAEKEAIYKPKYITEQKG